MRISGESGESPSKQIGFGKNKKREKSDEDETEADDGDYSFHAMRGQTVKSFWKRAE